MKHFREMFLLLCCFFSLPIYCQSVLTIADSGVVYKKGIYRSFDDFKYNKPYYDTVDFSIEEKTRTYDFYEPKEHLYFKLIINNESSIMEDSVYGFCEGSSIYIAESFRKYKKGMLYHKLSYVGRYCLFQKIEAGGTSHNGMGTGYTSYGAIFSYVLNTNNGGQRPLSLFTMKEILHKDSDLLKEFMNEKKKMKKAEEYIIKYSKKHFNEIKR